MLEITKNINNLRVKDGVIGKNTRMDMSKKRQKNNIDPDGGDIAISNINQTPYEDLQNRMTSMQVARNGLENSISILEKMENIVYSDSDNNVDILNKKRFEGLKDDLIVEKQQLENSINELHDSKDNKIINDIINENKASVVTKKSGHLEFIKSLKSTSNLNSIHKGLTTQKVASLLG